MANPCDNTPSSDNESSLAPLSDNGTDKGDVHIPDKVAILDVNVSDDMATVRFVNVRAFLTRKLPDHTVTGPPEGQNQIAENNRFALVPNTENDICNIIGLLLFGLFLLAMLVDVSINMYLIKSYEATREDQCPQTKVQELGVLLKYFCDVILRLNVFF